ncbi:MAG TPA: alanine--tRNA ligase-related protein, partial [Rhodoferax sp.]|nr:alanine--tRNA ligase-related protein [Rhodoferax sp.]
NYEIDIFDALIKAAARETACPDLTNNSLKVIADHIRATAFLVSDGVLPGNEGRGYVQRRIIRRAIRHGYKLGQKTPFFHKLVPDLVAQMGDAYPGLAAQSARIMEVLRVEEERFYETLANGMEILETEFDMLEIKSNMTNEELATYELNSMKIHMGSNIFGSYTAKPISGQGELLFFYVVDEGEEDAANQDAESESAFPDHRGNRIIVRGRLQKNPLSGVVAFKLHDTYGFPLDLTNDVCRERGVVVDSAGFDAAMARQKSQGRAAGKFKQDRALEYHGAGNAFLGYEQFTVATEIVAIYADGVSATALNAGQSGVLVLAATPFYGESGGQVGDAGAIFSDLAMFDVADTQKIKSDVFGHYGTLKSGALKVGDQVTAHVNASLRLATMRNHSATHLMHKALREVLGSHVQQKGSLVNPERTRFDFAHNTPVSDGEIREIEARVNAEILTNAATQARVMAIEEAKKTGAMMLFGEKYGESVRVQDIGSSRELCGGTHVQRTGDIGLFKVVAESGVASGVRRIEAVTAVNALLYMQQLEDSVNQAAGVLKAPVAEVVDRIVTVLEHVKTLEKEVTALKGRLASAQGDELVAQAQDINGVKLLVARLDGADVKTLRDTMDKLKDKLKTAVIVLAVVDADKVQIAVGVTANTTGRVKAGELVNFVAAQVGGKGGGKPDLAMAGGTEPGKLAAALASVAGWVTPRL